MIDSPNAEDYLQNIEELSRYPKSIVNELCNESKEQNSN